MRTQVGIVGAGPAGLTLSHLLHLAGIESIVVENRSREYCENRVRAGLMENWVARMLIDTGVGERLQREAMVHDGIYLAFNGEARKLDFTELVGKHVYIYDQKEVVTDLIADRLARGTQILFEVEDTSVHEFSTERPKIRFKHEGKPQEIECDFLAGCDGFHGVCRPSMPADAWAGYDRVYPYAWLGILSESPPPEKELIYAYHERGFALFSMRGPDLSRLYLQVEPDEDINEWPDARIWEELNTRLGGVRPLPQGNILQKGVTPMRSYVTEPMQSGRLFLAGELGAHRAADRRQRHEPRDGRRARAGARVRSLLPRQGQRGDRALFGLMSQPCVEGPALLMVDDADAASPARRRLCRIRHEAAARRARLRDLVARSRGFAGGELRRAADRVRLG